MMASQYGFLINIKDCYGCKTCQVVCNSENKMPSGLSFRNVSEFTSESPHSQAFISMACNHCEDPKCVEACPVTAYTKRDDGIVVQDHELCIGCKSCIEACPYDAPKYDPAEKKVSKCDMCADLIDEGKEPKCVEFCPGNVLKFGKIDELRKEYGSDIAVIEKDYDMPSYEISKPNIVIVPVK